MEKNSIQKKHLFRGKVISKKMSKTATVLFERTFIDKTVKKIVMKRKKFHVHDPHDQTSVGDEITFYDGQHISKIKYMHLAEVIKSEKKGSFDGEVL
jgi:small subunit ribosomal protein S17